MNLLTAAFSASSASALSITATGGLKGQDTQSADILLFELFLRGQLLEIVLRIKMSEKDRTEIVSLGEQGSGGGAAGGKIYKDEQPRSGDGRKGGFQVRRTCWMVTGFG